MNAENRGGLGGQRNAHLPVAELCRDIPKQGLKLMRLLKRRVADGDFERASLTRIVIDHQKVLFRQLAKECVVRVVPSDMPLLTSAQSGMALAQIKQRVHVGENFLLLR